MLSYDGRNQEPVTLPVKFPLLLAQGVEGIAVGLASKILPHNFNELIDASIAYLRGDDFEIYPDFPTGGWPTYRAITTDCARRSGQSARPDQQDRQTDAGDHRNSVRHDHRVDQGFDHPRERQRQDQNQEGRRQYVRQGRDRNSRQQRRVVRPDDRRAVRVHRLRSVDLAERLRHHGREASLHGRPRNPATLRRPYQRTAQTRIWRSGWKNSNKIGTCRRSKRSSSRTGFTS